MDGTVPTRQVYPSAIGTSGRTNQKLYKMEMNEYTRYSYIIYMYKLHSTYEKNSDYLLDTVSLSDKNNNERYIVLPFVDSDFFN